ncbi:MAG: phage major tail protein, TP901-1 family [Clostridium sp.]|uniref:phage major tail protein, TP901-1 family n=1 Tax=Clostridium sp. TaxID=1506 RepID=UPI003F3849C3
MGTKQTGMKCLVYVSATKTDFIPASNGNITDQVVDVTKVLGGQRNATLSRSAETIDATSKDTVGNWMESLPGFKSWSIECEACYIADDTSYQALNTAFLAGKNVYVLVTFGELGTTGVKGMVGEATITDFPIELPYDDLVTYSLTLNGSGALAEGTFKKKTSISVKEKKSEVK